MKKELSYRDVEIDGTIVRLFYEGNTIIDSRVLTADEMAKVMHPVTKLHF